MRRFKRNPENKGKIIQTGCWKYSRHPNYFGEALLWWGISIITWVWYAVFSPLVLTLLLIFVTGVPLLEKRLSEREEFKEYKSRTSMFFPWCPKRRHKVMAIDNNVRGAESEGFEKVGQLS